MPKQGEVDYVSRLADEEIAHLVNKPFSDGKCGQYLLDLGLILSLLPPPPGRLLDLGVGPGWTSRFFAQRGYEVVGQDIAPDMIDLARDKHGNEDLLLEFIVSDYETMSLQDEFDCAVFYDALHHAEDEEQALASIFQALKPNGICITAEPGAEHGRDLGARAAVARFGVTERSMPPGHIIEIGRRVGFRSFEVYERPSPKLLLREPDCHLWRALRRALRALLKDPWKELASRSAALTSSNIVVLRKGSARSP
jgi:SAM-dependent methyltransferase